MQMRTSVPARKIALAVGVIAGAAGICVAVGSNRLDLALAGIFVFAVAAWVVCTLEGIR